MITSGGGYAKDVLKGGYDWGLFRGGDCGRQTGGDGGPRGGVVV